MRERVGVRAKWPRCLAGDGDCASEANCPLTRPSATLSPPVGGEGHDSSQLAPNARFSSAINPAAKAACVSPSPAKRYPQNRVDMTAGEGRGEGHTPASLHPASACASATRVAPSPGLRPPSPPRRGARDTIQACARPTKGFTQQRAQRRKPRAWLPLPREDVRETEPG